MDNKKANIRIMEILSVISWCADIIITRVICVTTKSAYFAHIDWFKRLFLDQHIITIYKITYETSNGNL